MAAHQTLSHPWKPPLHLLLVAAAATLLSAPAAAQNNNNNNNNPYPLSNFNPSMAIVIVVLVCVFFFLGFFSIYVRQCAGSGGAGAGASVTARALQAAVRSRQQRGLDPAVLETFPTLVYSEVKGLKIGKESLECAVCLSEFGDEEKLRLLPKCNHVFHPDCIDAWLSSHVTCPVCRANLAEPTGDSMCLESQAELIEASGTYGAPPASQPEQMVITVDHDRESCDAEAAELERIGSQRRQARAAAAGRPLALAPPLRFPRSHSTGHSLVQTKDKIDRYTLRLPQHIRREIVVGSKLQRTKSSPANSFAVGGSGEGSTRRGRRLGRSDRWPSFLVRTLSVSAWGSRRGGNGDREESLKKNGSTRRTDGGEGSVRGKLFDCLGGGTTVRTEEAAADESPTAPLARV